MLAIRETITRALWMPFRQCAWRRELPSPPPLPRPRRFVRVGPPLPTRLLLSRTAARLRAYASQHLSPLHMLFSALPPNSVPWLAHRSAISWLPAMKLLRQLSLPDACLQIGARRPATPPFGAHSWRHGLTLVIQ